LCVRGADGEDVPGVGGNDVGGDEVDLVGGIGVALGVEVTSVGASAKEEGAFDLDADSDCEQAALLRLSGAGHDFWPPPMACDGLYCFAAFGACSTFPHYAQRLAPWAAFLSLLRSLGLFRDRVLVYGHSRPDSQFGLLLLLL